MQGKTKQKLSHNTESKVVSAEELNRVVSDLRIHQIELEMQNEELKRMQLVLDISRARYFDIYDLAPVGYLILTEKGLISEANLTAANMLGLSRGTLNEKRLSSFIFKEDQDIYYGFLKRVFLNQQNQDCELRMVKNDDTLFWVHLEATMVLDEYQKPFCRIVLNDITARRTIEVELRKKEEEFQAIFKQSPIAIEIYDAYGGLLYVNESCLKLFGAKFKDQTASFNLFDDPNISNHVKTKLLLENEVRFETLYDFDKVTRLGLYDTSFSGTKNMDISIKKLIEDDSTYRYVVQILDITDQKKAQEHMHFLSYHDQLTDLYNRRFFEEEMQRLDTERNLPLTIAMGDVNGLKLVNDSFGHDVGDQLLKKVADIIKMGCRADDIVARLGGDEFVIILPNTDKNETERVISRIQNLAAKEKVESLDISISFGFETKIKKKQNILDTFKEAEDHMYRHKLYESSSMRSNMIDVIMHTLYEKNPREMQHSKRVSEVSQTIAALLRLDKDEVSQIGIAGLMHDIGKIGIDEKLLNSAKKLNTDEWKEIKRHSEIGYRILSSANEFSEIALFVLDHHERWDGKGYPKGLKGDAISLPGRIIAIADAFDAMTSERTYKNMLSLSECLDEMRSCSGTQFDPAIAKVFIESLSIQ